MTLTCPNSVTCPSIKSCRLKLYSTNLSFRCFGRLLAVGFLRERRESGHKMPIFNPVILIFCNFSIQQFCQNQTVFPIYNGKMLHLTSSFMNALRLKVLCQKKPVHKSLKCGTATGIPLQTICIHVKEYGVNPISILFYTGFLKSKYSNSHTLSV